MTLPQQRQFGKTVETRPSTVGAAPSAQNIVRREDSGSRPICHVVHRMVPRLDAFGRV